MSNIVTSSVFLLLIYFEYRAPVLVALALIESGMKYEDAVEFIRRYPVLFPCWHALSHFWKAHFRDKNPVRKNVIILCRRNLFPKLQCLCLLNKH